MTRPIPALAPLLLLALAACDLGAPDVAGPSSAVATAAPAATASASPAPAPTAAVTRSARVPERIIAPDGTDRVKIGDTLAQLRARGLAAEITQEPFDPGATCGYARVDALPDVAVMLDGETVVRLEVADAGAGWTTPEGARVGTTEAELKAIYGSRVAFEPHKYTGPTGHYAIVHADGSDRGTIFETDGTRVLRWRTGRWAEVQFVEGCA